MSGSKRPWRKPGPCALLTIHGRALLYLTHHADSTAADIAENMGYAKGTMTRILSELKAEGLVTYTRLSTGTYWNPARDIHAIYRRLQADATVPGN